MAHAVGTRRGALVRASAVMAFAAAALLVAPAAAPAALTCSFDAGAARPTVQVRLTSNSTMRLEVVGSAIEVQTSGGVAVPCDGDTPTTTNTDAIRINAARKKRKPNLVVVETPTAYEPGVEDEGVLDADEIELRVDLGAGSDELSFFGENSAESIVAGNAGINLNPGDTTEDVDLVPRRVEELRFFGNDGADTFDAGGGAATGGPFPRPTVLDGGQGIDILTGGLAADFLAGGTSGDQLRGGRASDEIIGAPGDDDLFGNGGRDRLSGSADGDLLDGGGDVDTALYSFNNGPAVFVDIGTGGTNDGGALDGPVGDRDEVLASVENLLGEGEDDSFTGDADANRLVGGIGIDSLSGLAGPDLLKARDGFADALIDCGPGKDTARRDAIDPPGVSC